jgi:hypothetical protein
MDTEQRSPNKHVVAGYDIIHKEKEPAMEVNKNTQIECFRRQELLIFPQLRILICPQFKFSFIDLNTIHSIYILFMHLFFQLYLLNNLRSSGRQGFTKHCDRGGTSQTLK